MSLETMTKLATTTVGVGGSASIDFSSIPSTYTDLVLKYSTRCTAGANVGIVLSLNGSTANFTDKYLESSGSAATSGSNAQSGRYIGTSGDGGTSTPNNGELYIPNYAGSANKSFSVDAVAENNGTLAYSNLVAGLWSNTAAINQVTIACTSGNFSQYSTFSLYGIKNAAKTAGNSIKATGGNIVFDGTYVYHSFLSSDTFTPTQPIIADVLVVAGGGGGRNGGGGAGGYRTSTGFSAASGTALTVTVGAGGATATNGSNSQFSTISSTAGGSAIAGNQGNSGGSGGGGGDGTSGVGGAGNLGGYSPVEGYNGSNGTTGSGGGGGGASANATIGSTNVGGAGGTGATSSISGTSTVYAGGGGGGGSSTGGTGGTGGGGNGQGGSGAAAVAGTTNRGSGGGGGWGGLGAAGGSGIIVIRYKG